MIKKIMKYSGFAVTLVGITFSFQACHTTKKVTGTEPVKIVLPELKPEEYLAQKIEYNTFSGKASMHLEQKDQNQDFSTNLRMQKDKNIWASVIALGIAEVARAYITPDSLQAIIRIGKKAYALSYQEGLELIQAQVEFPVLQNLFIGNPLISDAPIKSVVEKDSLLIITVIKDDFTEVLRYNKEKRILHHLQLTSEQRNFNCEIRYEKYAPIGKQQPFAYNRYITIKNKDQMIKLDMEFGKAELDVPVDVSFSIPASYERVAIKKK